MKQYMRLALYSFYGLLGPTVTMVLSALDFMFWTFFFCCPFETVRSHAHGPLPELFLGRR